MLSRRVAKQAWEPSKHHLLHEGGCNQCLCSQCIGVMTDGCCADMLSLITCAAKQEGEPSTHDLLRSTQITPREVAQWKGPNAIEMVH